MLHLRGTMVTCEKMMWRRWFTRRTSHRPETLGPLDRRMVHQYFFHIIVTSAQAIKVFLMFNLSGTASRGGAFIAYSPKQMVWSIFWVEVSRNNSIIISPSVSDKPFNLKP
jgi:hypothetical protein